MNLFKSSRKLGAERFPDRPMTDMGIATTRYQRLIASHKRLDVRSEERRNINDAVADCKAERRTLLTHLNSMTIVATAGNGMIRDDARINDQIIGLIDRCVTERASRATFVRRLHRLLGRLRRNPPTITKKEAFPQW